MAFRRNRRRFRPRSRRWRHHEPHGHFKHIRPHGPRIPWILTKISTLFIIYVAILIGLMLLPKDIFTSVMPIIKYPFYLISLAMGIYLPYRLFKKYEYRKPRSDLELWTWRFVPGIVAVGCVLMLLFFSVISLSLSLGGFGQEFGNGLLFFILPLTIGMVLFGGYMFFKYQRGSGVIIHRGASW